MSTKIYNGFIVNRSCIDVYHELIKARPTFDEAARAEIIEALVTGLVHKLDYNNTVDPDFKVNTEVLDNLLIEVSKATLSRPKGKDEEYEKSLMFPELWVQLFPDGDSTLAYVPSRFTWGLNGDVLSSIGFKDYSYYNNTDQPDDISDEEWDKRRDKWDEIFDRSHDKMSFETAAMTMTIRPRDWYQFALLKYDITVGDVLKHATIVANPHRTGRNVAETILRDEHNAQKDSSDSDSQECSLTEMLKKSRKQTDELINAGKIKTVDLNRIYEEWTTENETS